MSTKRNAVVKASLNLTQRDVDNIVNLMDVMGRPTNRTEVITRALALVATAFVKHEASEIAVMKHGMRSDINLTWKDTFE